MSDTKEREKFEAWASSERFTITVTSLGNYDSTFTRRAWEAWQAAREQQAKELAEAQARIELLEHDMKSGDFESLYANTVFELQEAQARVVVLSEAIKEALEWPEYGVPQFELWKLEAALASTDTAAQTLRDKWIPVSERLPEPDTYVLYYNGKYTGFGKWVSGEWCESDERWQTDFGEYIELLGPKITHWQPLPEPPKEKP